MSNTQIAEIHRWARELLGGRGYLRAMNDSAQRARIEHIADALASGQIDSSAVRAAFVNAESSKRGIDQLFADIEDLTVRRMPSAKSRAAVPVSSREIDMANAELVRIQNQMREIEAVVRVLVERAVLDAARIRGLETAIMALAQNTGVEADLGALYGNTTADYLAHRGFSAA